MKTLKISNIPFTRESYEFKYKESVEIIIDERIPQNKELTIEMIPVVENRGKVMSSNTDIGSIENYCGEDFGDNAHARVEKGHLIVEYYPEVHIANKNNYDIENLKIRTRGPVFLNNHKMENTRTQNTARKSQNLPGSSRGNSFDWESFNAAFSHPFFSNSSHSGRQHSTFNRGNMSQTIYTPEGANVEVVNVPPETRNLHIGDNYVYSANEMANLPSTTRQTTNSGSRVRVMRAGNLDTLHIGNTYHIDHTNRREQDPSRTHRAQQQTTPDLPPSYQEVVGSGVAAAAGLPPAYSEMPKERETTIASNLSGSTTNSLSNNLRRR